MCMVVLTRRGYSLVLGVFLTEQCACALQLADEAVCIGEPPSSLSYLSIPNIIAAAVSHGCDALHPVRTAATFPLAACAVVQLLIA